MNEFGDMSDDPDDDGPFPNPGFGVFFSAHDKLVKTLRKFSLERSVGLIGGMITMPEFQASTLRLEVLQHLVVASARGGWKPRACWVKSWLIKLGDGYAGRLEDPVEDVFVSRVSGMDADYLIFEGIYEGSAFYLQKFLNILQHMPDDEPFSGIKQAVRALLVLSTEVVTRSSLAAFAVGEIEPLQEVPLKLVRRALGTTERVVFTADDLDRIAVTEDDLETFVFDLEDRASIRQETLGHSSLERFPILRIKDRFYLALPTAVSMSIRRLIVEFCVSNELEDVLYRTYADEIGSGFEQTAILGGTPSSLPPFQSQGGIFFSNIARYFDKGRVLHVCFIVDDFAYYDETGVVQFRPDSSRFGKIVEGSIKQVHNSFSTAPGFREGLTLIVLCRWARPMAIEFEGVNDSRWRTEFVSDADLETISWVSSFSPPTLLSLLDARDKLAALDVQLINVNGLLNLYAWSESLEGHLIPHGRLPDDSADQPLTIFIQQNSLLDVRRRGAVAWNVHRAKAWDGRIVRIRRYREDSIFEEDRDKPLYVSLDDFEQRRLVAVYETMLRGWWATIDTPNTENSDLHYRLWHAVTTWLERSAEILEKHIHSLPQGPIAWQCSFEDKDPIDPDNVVPSREQARALLSMSVGQNVVHVTAKEGFLYSFRHPTNIGESLLVEALVRGTAAMSSVDVAEKSIRAVLTEIIPGEWARDMHSFSAQRFRDFVGHRNSQKRILISKADDALSRIGLGWRARKRDAGARVEGVDACCEYLNEVVDCIWQETRSDLKIYGREAMLANLVSNHEAIALESDRWLRTARSVLAFHRDKEATARESAKQIARFNGATLSSRILMEMALCECPDDGIEPGRVDISRLMANAMQMHYLGGWSEAIKYCSKRPEVRITPLGDVHTHVDFDETIATPYGQALGIIRFRDSADAYEQHFQETEPVVSAQGKLDADFWDAWTSHFGFTIDQLRVFMDNLDDEGIRHNDLFYIASPNEIVALESCSKLDSDVVRKILDGFSLKPRSTWALTPSGFSAKDWYPWRFRRRLSVIRCPILQMTDDPDGRYMIAPGMIRDGVAKTLDYCYSGGYDAKDFPKGPMRSWIGAAVNKRGHRFNSTVAKRLRDLGWQTRSEVKLTEILNTKLDRDYGDVDVIAWKGARLLAVECKDLEMAMTTSDIAHQLYDFRGEIGQNGKPDRLKKHLRRLELLKNRASDVRKFAGMNESVSIEGGLVFSRLVPMHFAGVAANHDVHLATIDELDRI